MPKFKVGDIVFIGHLGAPIIAICEFWQSRPDGFPGFWRMKYVSRTAYSQVLGHHWREEYLSLMVLSPLEKVIYEIHD